MNIEQARYNMIEQQIRPWEVLDQNILSLLAVVKREDFVPPALRALAFVDTEVPLRDGGARGQSMLAPKVEARLLQDAGVQRHEHVLQVGTGSGYVTALLAHRAREVVSFEIVPELAAQAVQNLRRAAIGNARVITGDGAGGLSAEAPFDVIVLSGSVASVPEALLAQLKVGGRLVAIVGFEPVMRATLVTRVADASAAPGAPGAFEFRSVELFDTVAPRLLGFPEPERFRF